MKKVILSLVGVAIVLALAGAYVYPKSSLNVGASPTGTTWGTQRIATINWSLVSPSATSTSLLNYDSQDRIIESSFLVCDSIANQPAVTSMLIKAATTTTNTPATVTNTVLASNLTLATSTSRYYIATSTDPTANAIGRTWPAGTYLTFWSNATNTAQCTVGVKYIQR